jgi:hypothetical protein
VYSNRHLTSRSTLSLAFLLLGLSSAHAQTTETTAKVDATTPAPPSELAAPSAPVEPNAPAAIEPSAPVNEKEASTLTTTPSIQVPTDEAVAPAASRVVPEATASALTPAPILPPSSQKSGEKAAKKGPEISGKPGQGVTIRVSDAYSLNVKSRIQIRYQSNITRDPDTGTHEVEQLVGIGTARLWFSGNVFFPQLTYMLQLAVAGRDFRDGATSPVYDAFLDWKAHRDISAKAGQYFVPFDRLRTVRESGLQMADRPRPVAELTLDRDVGVTAYSGSFLGDHSPLAWYLGAFGGGGTNLTTARQPGGLFVGRVELRPLGSIDDDKEGDLERRAKPALAVGAAFAANINTNRLRSTTGPTFTGGTTDYLHAAADLVFKWSGFALQAEYLWKDASSDTINSTAADGSPLTEYTRSGQGWVTQASYVFDPPIEVVGRLSGMYASKGTDPTFVADTERHGQEVGAGLNYYLNDHQAKVQADWIARMPHDFNFQEADHALHLQLDVTF